MVKEKISFLNNYDKEVLNFLNLDIKNEKDYMSMNGDLKLDLLIQNLKSKKEILENYIDKMFMDNNKLNENDNIKRLLLERYLHEITPTEIELIEDENIINEYESHVKYSYSQYNDDMKVWEEKITYDDKPEVSKDIELNKRKIKTENWKLLSRRISRKISTGLLGFIDDKNSEYIYLDNVYNIYGEDTIILESLKKEENKDKLEELLKLYSEIFEIMIYNRIFLPSSPFIFNAGRGILGKKEYSFLHENISNMNLEKFKVLYSFKDPAYGSCYSMGKIEDSLEGIYGMNYKQSKIFQQAGGFGTNFSDLRSRYAEVSTIKGKSTGTIAWMKPFNQNTELVALTSSLKRGANMFILNDKHPEIEDFIDIKRDYEEQYSNMRYANLSVSISNEFLDSVYKNNEWTLQDPHDETIKKDVNGRELWTKLISNASIHAEPGIVNFDNINKDNPIEHIERINSTNPCGEYTGYDETVCNLGSINIYSLLRFNEYNQLELDSKMLELSSYFLNSFLTLSIFSNEYPLEELTDRSKKYRPTGGGLMGLSSTLVLLKKRYGSKESVEFIDRMMKIYTKGYLKSTLEMGNLIGGFKHHDESKFIHNEDDKYYYNYKNVYDLNVSEIQIGNGRQLSVAPTGSISYLSNISGGLEPIFLLTYNRKINPNQVNEYSVLSYDQSLYDYFKLKGLSNDEILKELEKISNGEKSDFINESDDYLVTTSDLQFTDHLIVLYTISKYIDMNSSKTMNIQRKGKSIKNIVNELEKFEDILPELKDKVLQFKDNYFDIKKEKKYLDNYLKDYQNFKSVTNFLMFDSKNKKLLQDIFNEGMESFESGKKSNINQTINRLKDTKEYEYYLDLLDNVNSFYLLSQVFNIKGVTVYVEGGRTGILTSTEKPEDKFDFKLHKDKSEKYIIPRERPRIMDVLKTTVNFGKDNDKNKKVIHIELGFDTKNDPFELIIRTTKSSKEYTELANSIGRNVSNYLRLGGNLLDTLKQQRKIKDYDNNESEFANIISNATEELYNISQKNKKEKKIEMDNLNAIGKDWIMTTNGYYIDENGKSRCPVCYEELSNQESCNNCVSCGWSKCN